MVKGSHFAQCVACQTSPQTTLWSGIGIARNFAEDSALPEYMPTEPFTAPGSPLVRHGKQISYLSSRCLIATALLASLAFATGGASGLEPPSDPSLVSLLGIAPTNRHPEGNSPLPVPFHSQLPPPSYPQFTLSQGPFKSTPQSLWPLVRAAMRLDHRPDNKLVQQEIAWLRKHRDFVDRLAPRFERYAGFIFQEVQRRNMPGELLFLAVIESALDPFAFSPGGAAGLWQFMPATAKRFDLKIDWWADERRDPILATRAALDYLELLHRRFESWELAIAAYNAGEGRISGAIRKAGSKDFFDLRIPSETAGYLPRLLAFATVFKEPERYGLRLPHVSSRVALRLIETGSQLDLNRAASALGVTVENLYDWNPALNQWATHPRGPHQLLVGHTRGDSQLLIDQIPAAERLAWQRHVIKPGESLSVLAQRYHTDVAVLMRANDLSSKKIRTGRALLIPTGSDAANGVIPARRGGTGKKTYRVVRGDSMSEIAQRFNVPLTRLQRLNHVGPTQYLKVGQRLIIPAPTGGVVKEIQYRVREGDSLGRIAQRFNVTTGEIQGWNELDLAKYLQPGQRLRLYVDLTVAN